MEKKNRLYNLLANPTVYRKLQELLGGKEPKSHKLIKAICQEYFHIKGKKPHLLDLGCGEGKLCESTHNDCIYYGLDYSDQYINHAKQIYKNKGTFMNADISSLKEYSEFPETWDFIVALGLFHHLDDQDVLNIKTKIFDANPQAIILTIDPVFIENQNRIAKFIISKDRGRFVRSLKEYSILMSSYQYRLDNLCRIPYNHILFHHNISEEQFQYLT